MTEKTQTHSSPPVIVTAWIACQFGAGMIVLFVSDGIQPGWLGLFELVLILLMGLIAFEGAKTIFWWRYYARLEKSPSVSPSRLMPLSRERVAEYPYRAQGYVYVIRDSNVTGYVKIGRTNHPIRRLMDFAVKPPFDVEVLMIVPCANAAYLERMLHNAHKERRVNGEWFNFDDYALGLLLSFLDTVSEDEQS